MQEDSNKNKKLAVLFWVLSAVCMGVIFWFSSRTATESTGQSNVFVEWLESLFGKNEIWVFIVRKSAHCLEFTGLAVLLSLALYFTRGKISYIISLLIASAYAVTDEVHQTFVEGRSCELRDWAIDTVGALLGIIGFYVLYKIIQAIINKKRKQK